MNHFTPAQLERITKWGTTQEKELAEEMLNLLEALETYADLARRVADKETWVQRPMYQAFNTHTELILNDTQLKEDAQILYDTYLEDICNPSPAAQARASTPSRNALNVPEPEMPNAATITSC